MSKQLTSIPFLRFLFFLLMQVLVIDYVDIPYLSSPYLYIFFIILLPSRTAHWALMLWGMAMGLCVDLFSGTLGLHAIPTLLIAYIRPYLLHMINSHEQVEIPSIRSLGFDWFVTYSTIMIVVHHSVLLFLEVFKLIEWGHTLKSVLISSVLSLAILMISQFIFVSRKK